MLKMFKSKLGMNTKLVIKENIFVGFNTSLCNWYTSPKNKKTLQPSRKIKTTLHNN